MRIIIYLAHPAHFHLFKNIANELHSKHKVFIVYNNKDVLHELLSSADFSFKSYKVKTNKNVNSKLALSIQFILKIWGAFKLFKKLKPDIVVGTPILISLISRVLPYKSLIVNEDDFDVVEKTANLGYPYANHIICPIVCRTTKFDEKSIKYHSYHELAYLHPNHFTPDKAIVEKYFSADEPYFIIRFAKLIAHHDSGIKGISSEIAMRLIEILKPHGKVYITSERELDPKFEPYRMAINPLDIHHVMAFAKMYIGDSQTMAAEAGVLGTPFIRFNDFVGRISYLAELEDKYHLGYGILPNERNKLFNTVEELLSTKNIDKIFRDRQEKMLAEKIDLSKFLIWFIENYPESVKTMKENPNFQYTL